ncbi:hypothetical protein DV532_28265 (plasmid) [Pseudomonas sp. Leaf58]|uniref:hypothetical protein n=1 Tax=Pseudomonas sp. Leaf58 TaxID=1736226 RepID=UPI0006FB7C9F|nr:hypothetical protein [Pseudomonas sp. Leaf58]AYG48165.1 hypothetical protein DV532_28265 [Pseudomonas sp. Leaf58]KQN62284.1 hypothetical protein ASF02_08965 [Pseudomonas sp. Leaf58]
MNQFNNLQDLWNQTDGKFNSEQLRVTLKRKEPLSSPYPFTHISELQVLCGDDSPGPQNRVVLCMYALSARYAANKIAEAELDVALFMQRLEQDEHALNWILHAELGDRWVAGNDQNLVDLVLSMSTLHKCALLCAVTSFGESDLMRLRFGQHLDGALRYLCEYVSQPRCQAIDSLPVNFELNHFNPTMLNGEVGQPGRSTVILNASPVNTLPRSVLHQIAFHGHSLEAISAQTRATIQRFALPTELCHELAYRWLKEFLKPETNSAEFRNEIDRDTQGTVSFEDVFTTDWNCHYPTLTAEFDDFTVVGTVFPGNHRLNRADVLQMCKVFSKFIAYGDLGGLSNSMIAQHMIDNREFFEQAFIRPEPSLLHNFSHSDGAYGREQVDTYLDHYHDIITGSYISRYSSYAASIAVMGERLLAYLDRLHSPAKDAESSEHLYHHALAKLVAMTLKRGQELGVFDLKELVLSTFLTECGMTAGLSGRSGELHYDRHLFERALCALPAELVTPDVRLCCGVGLTGQELADASEDQLARSLTLDMGL